MGIELQAELLGKQSQEKATREDLQNGWNKKHAKGGGSFEHPADNLSKMGLFTQSGLLFNPQLDISKQQLEKLTSMERNISSIASRPDIWN